MKHILLLGGSGFIGSAILKQLADKDQYYVTVVQHNNPPPFSKAGNIHIISSSISNLNLSSFDHFPDVVIHAARNRTGRFGRLGRFILSMKGRYENKKLLNQIERSNKKTKIIYISGSLMYGSHPNELITESSPLHPISYAREYVNAELPFYKAVLKNDPNVIMLRVPWVIGYGSWFKWFYADYINAYKEIPLYTHNKGMMTFIDIEDLAQSIIRLCDIDFRGLLNLFYPKYVAHEEWANILSELTGYPIKNPNVAQQQKITNASQEAFNADICLSSVHTELQKHLNSDQVNLKEIARKYLDGLLKHEQ